MDISLIRKIRNLTDSELIDVALKLAAHDVSLFEKLVAGSNIELRMHDVPFFVSEEQLRKLVAVGNHRDVKVTTIKIAREMFNIGLKEAKDLVEILSKYGYLCKEFFATSGTSDSNWVCKFMCGPGNF